MLLSGKVVSGREFQTTRQAVDETGSNSGFVALFNGHDAPLSSAKDFPMKQLFYIAGIKSKSREKILKFIN